jgi:hypothetical protein
MQMKGSVLLERGCWAASLLGGTPYLMAGCGLLRYLVGVSTVRGLPRQALEMIVVCSCVADAWHCRNMRWAYVVAYAQEGGFVATMKMCRCKPRAGE